MWKRFYVTDSTLGIRFHRFEETYQRYVVSEDTIVSEKLCEREKNPNKQSAVGFQKPTTSETQLSSF